MATRTFLFVDQVGSTEQLTRLGDRAAQAVRRALFDLLRQATEVHGGHEVDFTGDGLFCAFDSAADATDAAVAMQQLVVTFNSRRPDEQHLGIRIGLHTGEPLESEGGGYFGAAVVVAARLCSQAVAGQVLASGLVRSLVAPRGEHPFDPLGPRDLKGVPEPVETFSVGWVPDLRSTGLPAPLAAARTEPFVGRRRELDAVLTDWDRLADGGRALVAVSGEQGMGVTRLLAEAAGLLRVRGASVWAGAGQGQQSRLAPWTEAVAGWAAVTPRAELRLALGDKAADLQRLVPGLADLVPRLPAPAPVDPAAEVFLVADAIDDLVTRWSAVEPLVVVLDRLEEADQASLTVLRRVAASPRAGRVLLLVGYEPSAVGTPRVLAELRDAGATDLRLEGLSADEVEELVAAVTDAPPSEGSLRAVLAESEGSPYFVLQMARSSKERRITGQVRRAVDEAGELRADLRLKREEITLALRELDQLRVEQSVDGRIPVEPDGTPPVPGDAPYRGLLAFRTEDAESFFGRDALVAEMLAALLSSSWLAVIGPSGSGKSSAVRAGLLPALARGALPDSAGWPAVVVSPGPDPLAALAGGLASLPGTTTGGSAEALLTEVTDGLDGGRRLLLVVDQFEELWTAGTHEDRERTVRLLVGAATSTPQRVLVVVCLRADQVGRLTEHPELAALCAEAQVLVTPMTATEQRAAVEQPARRAGWVLEPGLVQAVLDDVAGEPGALPLLSTALLETWERRRGHSLTLAGYAETGGARRAIATLADTTLDELDPADQDVARRLLLRLAAPTETGEDVARPAALAELVVDDATRRVLARLAERRLVTVGETTAQVAHEALLREWPRLRGWLAADRDGRRLHQQIASAAGQWEAAGRDDDALLRGARLAAADDWRTDHDADLTRIEREYLTASAELRTRELRRARRTTRRFQVLAAVLVVLLAGAAVAVGFAVVNSRTAQARATESTARGLAAQAAAVAGTRVDTALLLAVEGYRRNPSIDTQGGLLTALNSARYLARYRRDLPTDVIDIDVPPDRSSLAVLTSSGDLDVLDPDSGRPLGKPLVAGVDSGYFINYSPDGALMGYVAADGVHVVDARTGQPVGGPLGGGSTGQFSFSSDGRTVAVSGGPDDPGIRLIDLASGRTIGTVPDDDGSGRFAVIRPGADEIAVGAFSALEPVRRYRFDGTLLGEFAGEPRQIWGMTYSPDGTRLVATDASAVTALYDADRMTTVGRPIASLGARVGDAAFTPDGSAVALASDNGSVRVASIADGSVLADVSAFPTGAVIAFLADDRLLAMSPAGSAEFDLSSLTALGTSRRLPGWTSEVLPLPGGKRALIGQGTELVEVDGSGSLHPTGVHLEVSVEGAMALSPDARRIATLGYPPEVLGGAGPLPDPVLVIADRATGKTLVRTAVDDPSANGGGGVLSFSPDGRALAVGTYGGVTSIVDSSSGAVLVSRRTDVAAVTALSWSRDGRTLYEGGQDGVVRFLDPQTEDDVATVPLTPQLDLSDMETVPGGGVLAVSSEAGQVSFVDTARREVSGEPLEAEGTQLQAVAISPDGRQVAAVSRDGALRLWDRASGRAVGPPLNAHQFGALPIAYLGGDRLVTAGADSTLVVWNLAPEHWVDRACELAGRDLTRAEWARYLPDQPYRRTCTDR